MAIAYINIGTNLGDRRQNIDTTINAIEKELNSQCMKSDIYESEPWGFSSQNKFANIAIAINIDISPTELLDILQRVERSIGTNNHRKDDGTYADRIIDIDIMAIDNMVINTDTLVVPHQHLFNRPFFHIPMSQVAPQSLIQSLKNNK